MNRNAQVYDVNFISNKLLNINMVCTVETLHYFLNLMLAFHYYKVNIVYLKNLAYFKVRQEYINIVILVKRQLFKEITFTIYLNYNQYYNY